MPALGKLGLVHLLNRIYQPVVVPNSDSLVQRIRDAWRKEGARS
jgi:hypothetical protein